MIRIGPKMNLNDRSDPHDPKTTQKNEKKNFQKNEKKIF